MAIALSGIIYRCCFPNPVQLRLTKKGCTVATKKFKSRLMAEIHETAAGLHSAGLISKRRMQEFDALCHLGVVPMGAKEIRTLRDRFQLSQAVFAAVLNTSLSTVQKWEAGAKKPSGPSLKLLSLLERKGLEAVL